MKKLIRFILVLFLLTIFSSYLYIKLSPKPIINSVNNISLYDNNEEVFFQGSNNKEWVSLDNISKYLIDSTIYMEDKNFYKHHGFDLLRILKAFYINLTTHSTSQGASTITQQYAKNLFLDFDKTWKRKWQEMWYTLKIENSYSKEEILEGYLNTINYGHAKYGIENASKFYFNKSAKDLSLAEATMLTAIPKSPSNYSPLINYDLAKKRQLLVLETLVKNNIISVEEKDEAYNEELIFNTNKDDLEISSLSYYQDAVLDELENLKISLNDTGLKIYTTLDLGMQKKLDYIVKNELKNEKDLETAIVLMKPDTGEVISIVGGKDYNKSSYNRATLSKRQVGSTMKAFLYYAALENGFTPSSAFTSEETTFNFDNKTYSPKNYNNKYGNKPISMATAIAYSDNIYAVKTHLFLGEDALINTAKRVGITSKLEKVPSLALGTNEINILEMAGAYSTFANMGYKIKPHFIRKIVDNKGNILYEAKGEKDLVLNPSIVFVLNNLLTAPYDSLYIDYNYPTAISLASKLKHKYAIKSGTTDTDTWYMGFNKDVTCAVWVGYDDNREIDKTKYKYAKDLWYEAIEGYEEGKDDSWYEMPDNVEAVLVEPISGRIAKSDDKKAKLIYFIKGTIPSNTEQTFDEKSKVNIS